MVVDALELVHAVTRASRSGDGASDADINKGIREFFVFVAEVIGADGSAKALNLDGALVSYGLTSQAEVDVCVLRILRRRRRLRKDARGAALPMEGEKASHAACLPASSDAGVLTCQKLRGRAGRSG